MIAVRETCPYPHRDGATPMKYVLALAATLAMFSSGTAAAGDGAVTLTPACESALALSALPARLRSGASVYVWDGERFSLSQRGAGRFHCIVERNHSQALIPQCADAAGLESVIRGVMQKTEWALSGLSAAERQSRFDALVEKGVLRAPERAGVNYMMSAFNLAWNTARDGLMRIPPHVMFYAPNVSNDDIGGSMAEGTRGNRGVPFVIEEGIHGYMISFVERAADPADARSACRGQHSLFDESTVGDSP